MNTKRISKEMEKLLSNQMNKEAEAAQIYLSLGIWADSEGYSGIGNFLFRHHQEERNHMVKFMRYILDRGGKPEVSAIAKPIKDPKNISECFDAVFEQEVSNTTAIYGIVDLAFQEKDWATWNFAQWFVKEQIEEETLALELIDKLKISGGTKATADALFDLDKYLGKAKDEADLARDASTDHPG